MKGLLTAAGIPYAAGQEGAQIPALLQRLKDLAARAGGAASAPRTTGTDHIDALLALGGNQRFRAVADDHDRLSEDLERWRAADQQREKRERALAGASAPASPRRRTACRRSRRSSHRCDPRRPPASRRSRSDHTAARELAAALRAEVASSAGGTRRGSERGGRRARSMGGVDANSTPPTRKRSSPTPSCLPTTARCGTDEQLLEALDATPLSCVAGSHQPRA